MPRHSSNIHDSNSVLSVYRPDSMIAFDSQRVERDQYPTQRSPTKQPETITKTLLRPCAGRATKRHIKKGEYEINAQDTNSCNPVNHSPDYGLNAATWGGIHETSESPHHLNVSKITVLIDVLVEACAGAANIKRMERKIFERKLQSSKHAAQYNERHQSPNLPGSLNIPVDAGQERADRPNAPHKHPGINRKKQHAFSDSCHGQETIRSYLHSVEFDTEPSPLTTLASSANSQLNRPQFDSRCESTYDANPFQLLPQVQTPKAFSGPCTRVEDIYGPTRRLAKDDAAMANENYIRNFVRTPMGRGSNKPDPREQKEQKETTKPSNSHVPDLKQEQDSGPVNVKTQTKEQVWTASELVDNVQYALAAKESLQLHTNNTNKVAERILYRHRHGFAASVVCQLDKEARSMVKSEESCDGGGGTSDLKRLGGDP